MRTTRSDRREIEGDAHFRCVWVAPVGVFVIASAAEFLYCKARGYRGFNGRVEALKGPFGITIGVKIGCYQKPSALAERRTREKGRCSVAE
jgi:hypothetical protein